MIKVLVAMSAVMLAMDYIWLKSVMKGLYVSQVGHMLRMSGGDIMVAPLPTVLVYALMVGGLYYFAVRPSESLQESMFSGAVAGLFSYGIFALTNHAIFKDWAWRITLPDIAWGIVLMTIVAGVGYRLNQ
jgi:uncharacterized membrane protein